MKVLPPVETVLGWGCPHIHTCQNLRTYPVTQPGILLSARC